MEMPAKIIKFEHRPTIIDVGWNVSYRDAFGKRADPAPFARDCLLVSRGRPQSELN